MNYKQTIVLAALIGLMPACKDQINEPEKTAKQSGMSTNIYGATADETPMDAFMKHVPNVENVKFYIPREETSYLSFEINSASGDIYKMTEERDVAQTSTNILYPWVFNRTDNMSSDGTASFLSETTWNYTVSYQTPNNETRTWSIEDIPASELNVYANLSREAMAYLARDTILSRNPNEKAHADSVYMNIKYGHSAAVTQNEPTTVQFSSMGAQQHLTHSDFGTITYTKGATSETKVYLGTNMEDADMINVLNCPATSINITAYANVQRIGTNADGQQLVLTTGKNAGKYTIDINHNETIVMPFQNWYTVTLIKTPGKLRSYLTDSAHVVPAQWQLIHIDKVEDIYKETINENGLFCMVGIKEVNDYSGFRTCFSCYNFLDSDGKQEVISNGYREDYDASGDRIVMTFCFGGTDRYNEDPELTTGLEMIYCAPQR
jgi:hypothetical protein